MKPLKRLVLRHCPLRSRFIKIFYLSIGITLIYCSIRIYLQCDDCEIKNAFLKNDSVTDINFWSRRTKHHIENRYNCTKLINGDEKDVRGTINKSEKYIYANTSSFIDIVKDCPTFIKNRGYVSQYGDDVDNHYSIAYSILFHKDIDMVERLLFSIYRPEHYICFHVDAKADPLVQKAARMLADCFPNIFMTEQVDVVYASFTRLEADLNCMKTLLKQGSNWKYLINLVSQMFPIKTNAEIVEILKIYNGANDIEGLDKRNHANRWNKRYVIKGEGNSAHIAEQGDPKPPAPHNIHIVKGSALGVFSRAYVDFVIHDQRCIDLLEWSKDTYSPDEFYWSTLHHLKHNPHLKTPGGYYGVGEDKKWLAAYAAWGRLNEDPCWSGKKVRGICIFGVADLKQLSKRHELFANKFYLNFQPAALDCLESWLNSKKDDISDLDIDFYKNLPFIIKSN